MTKFFARLWAKHSYVFQLEHEAARTEINARLAENLAAERRQTVAKLCAEADEVESKLNKEADELDARIKEYSAKEEAGFWLCENGHESPEPLYSKAFSGIELSPPFCPTCQKPAKHVKRSEMTGQEQYESDKERRDAEKMSAEKRAAAKTESTSRRAAAKEEEDKAEGGEQTAKVFRANAENARIVANKIRNL
jgi:hypothetical protein